jgi:hypothetical protein
VLSATSISMCACISLHARITSHFISFSASTTRLLIKIVWLPQQRATNTLPNILTHTTGLQSANLGTSPPCQFYHVCSFLTNHIDRRHCVTGGDHWHDGSIYDAKTFNSSNTQLWVYHSVWIGVRSHLARTHLVVQGCGYCTGGTFPVFIRTEVHVFTPREWNAIKFTVVLLKCFGLAQGNCLVEKKYI